MDLVTNFFESTSFDIEQSIESQKLNNEKEKFVNISKPLKKESLCVQHSFKANSDYELSVRKDNKVFVLEKNISGWWFVENEEGYVGYVPRIILEKLDNESIPLKIRKFFKLQILNIYTFK